MNTRPEPHLIPVRPVSRRALPNPPLFSHSSRCISISPPAGPHRRPAAPSSINVALAGKGRPLAGLPRRRPTTAALPRRAASAGTIASGLPAGVEDDEGQPRAAAPGPPPTFPLPLLAHLDFAAGRVAPPPPPPPSTRRWPGKGDV
jgi:hypothetical protein